MGYLKILMKFTIQQALCCIFPAIIFVTLAVTKALNIPYRYDFILLICLLTQVSMVYFKLETIDELKLITLFHLLGLCLEIYKVYMGSWAYPEPAFFKILGVPLYSGFMYASVASYICQAWRRFELNFDNWPNSLVTCTFAVLIYLNFFTHHFILDVRWGIILCLFIFFGRVTVRFKVSNRNLKMPVLSSFLLIGFFIWIAENISTYFGAWRYPNQLGTWRIVHLGKISSWFLLVIVSIIIVVNLKHLKSRIR